MSDTIDTATKKYRKKPIVVEAKQWFKMGDHPGVYQLLKVFRPKFSCDNCQHAPEDHGVVCTLEGPLVVCPGDWIITGIKGELYPCKDEIFRATYEAVEDG